MKTRCYNPNSDSYKYYGARGIQICNEWKNNIECFYNWAMNNGYQNGLTIERKDINGNYDPMNCCWATPKQQARNTCRTKYVNYNGQNMSLAEACELANMNYDTVNNRLYKLHWDFEKAINEPVINYDQITYYGITKPLKTWANELNLNYDALRSRIRRGWPIEKAFTTPVRGGSHGG